MVIHIAIWMENLHVPQSNINLLMKKSIKKWMIENIKNFVAKNVERAGICISKHHPVRSRD